MSAMPEATDQVKFMWIVADAKKQDASQLAESLRQSGGKVQVQEPPSGILPILIPFVIFGAVVMTALTEQVVDWWSTRKKHGLLVHVDKKGKLEVKELDIPYGRVIVISPDGTSVTQENVSNDQLKVILDAAGKVASETAKASGT
jgi:hypothetical protein